MDHFRSLRKKIFFITQIIVLQKKMKINAFIAVRLGSTRIPFKIFCYFE